MTLLRLSIYTMLLLLASSTSAENLSLRRGLSSNKEPAADENYQSRLLEMTYDSTLHVGCKEERKSNWAGTNTGGGDPLFNKPQNQGKGCGENEVAVGFQVKYLEDMSSVAGRKKLSNIKLICDEVTDVAVKNYANLFTGKPQFESKVTLAGTPTPATTGSYGFADDGAEALQSVCQPGSVLRGIKYHFDDETSTGTILPTRLRRFSLLQAECAPLYGYDVLGKDGAPIQTDDLGSEEDTVTCGENGWAKSLGATTYCHDEDCSVKGLLGIRLNCCQDE